MKNNQLPQLGNLSELKSRFLFLMLALIVYRLGVHITVPGINVPLLMDQMTQPGEGQGLSAMMNLFSGGAFERMSIFMLGVMPYITASIVIQMLSVVYPPLEQIKKEGQAGRRKITQYTRYLTIVFAAAQGTAYAFGIVNGSLGFNSNIVMIPAFNFVLLAVITWITGTIFLMWLGEQISERGVGNGISMIIFASILMGMPTGVSALFDTARTEGTTLAYLKVVFVILFVMAIVLLVVFIERGQRRITINYARKQQGRQMSIGGQTTHLPLKLNMAGVIPAIFGSAFLSFVYTISAALAKIEVQVVDGPMSGLQKFSFFAGQFFQKIGNYGVKYFTPGQPAYMILFAALIIFFCFFYTAIQFNSKETAENLKRSGGFIPGIRPGIQTSQFFDKVLTRITLWGALYITAICLLPDMLGAIFNFPSYFGGTSILIAVVVVMDLIAQVQAQLVSQQYSSLMKKANISNALNGKPPSI